MKKALRLGLLTSLYALFFVIVTWPLAAEFSTSFLAVPGRDSYQYIWSTWYFRQAVINGQNPFFSDWVFFPHGSWLIMHAYVPILGMLGVLLGNSILGTNVGLLLTYALSGAGGYLLAKRWVKNPVLCWLAGFIFAFSPYKLQRLPEHYNLILTATVPFYILAFLQAFEFREGRFLPLVRSWAAVAGCLALGIVTLFSDYYVLFGLLYFSLFYAAWFWFRLGHIQWRNWRAWAWLGGILVVSHVVVRLLRLGGFNENGGIWWGGDLVAYLMPPPTSRFLYGSWAAQLYHNPKVFNMPGTLENTMFSGYTLLLLAALVSIGWLLGRQPASRRSLDPQGKPLAWVLLIFVMFTMPALRIYGHDRLNMPTALLHFIPFFNNIRCPTRWIMMVDLLMPILTFSALEAAWQDRVRPMLQVAFSLVLLAVVAVEFWPQPFQRGSAATIPAVYRQVASLPGTSLIPVPMGALDGYRQVGKMEAEQLYYQTLHQKKLLGGYLSRVSPALFQAIEQEPFLKAMLQVQTYPDSVAPAPLRPAQVQAFLRQYQPAAFVITPAYRNTPVHTWLRAQLQPFGYQEQPVEDHLLLAPATSPSKQINTRP